MFCVVLFPLYLIYLNQQSIQNRLSQHHHSHSSIHRMFSNYLFKWFCRHSNCLPNRNVRNDLFVNAIGHMHRSVRATASKSTSCHRYSFDLFKIEQTIRSDDMTDSFDQRIHLKYATVTAAAYSLSESKRCLVFPVWSEYIYSRQIKISIPGFRQIYSKPSRRTFDHA